MLSFVVGFVPPSVDYQVPLYGLGGDVGDRCRELLREIARSREMRIYVGALNRDQYIC